MALSKDERQAALDALMHILNQEPDDPGQPISKEFRDAWNKIMTTYGGNNFNNYTEADLIRILRDLYNGNLKLD